MNANATGVASSRRNPDRGMLASVEAAERFVRSFVTRARDGDAGLAELAAIVELHHELADSITTIATELLANDDYSYREIAIALGITRQAAMRRYPTTSTRRRGGQPGPLR